ncbi:MAG: VWA domain-containing protein, partial [Crinalium sp.]
PKPRTPLTNPQPLRQQTLALKRQINSLRKQADAELNPQKAEEIKQRLEELEEALKNVINEGKKSVVTAEKYAERLEKTGVGLKGILEEATLSAQQAVVDAAIALSAFGWGDSNGFGSKGINSEQKIQLAKRVAQNQKLQEIAKLAGRMKLLAAKKQRTKTKELATEIYSVTTGNYLAHLVPSELMKLVVPELKPLFIKGYSEKSLLQYQLKSKEKQGRGPIVVCLDSSGSMAGTKEQWSKAVGIALLTIANQQKRTCRILHFCASVCRVDDFPGGQLDPIKLVDCMECFYNGGTSWSAPLDSALAIIKSESQYKNADIIMITDDQCSVSSSWLESFKQSQKLLEFSTFGIMLGSSDTRALSQILDTVIAIPNLEQDREIKTVFGI